jgi:hypothetical protein
VGFLSGGVAAFLRKGSRRHGIAGNAFVVSMLTLAATGLYMAFMKSQPGNILGGALTFYLVTTAWMTARRRDGQPGIVDWVALLAGTGAAAVGLTYGLAAATSQTGLKQGVPAAEYFFLGSVALLAAGGDVRMLVRGGVSGVQRLARHLWRMCFAWFVAAGSIFLARQHLFPVFFRKTGLLFFLSFLPLIVMIFWLIRVRITKADRKNALPSAAGAYTLRA